MIKKYNEYIKENKKYTWDNLLADFYEEFIISMYFNNDKILGTIHVNCPDFLNKNDDGFGDQDYNNAWFENSNKVAEWLENDIKELLNIKEILNIPNDKFLLFKYLTMKFHKKFGWGELDKDEDYIDIIFYGNSANILSGNLHECFEDFQKYNYNVEEYVEKLIKENSKIFNNEYFIDLIENVDYLNNKYRHYIDANNFDIL